MSMMAMLMKLIFLMEEDFLLQKIATQINQHTNQTIVQSKSMMLEKMIISKSDGTNVIFSSS